jgi:hypothetical protein
VDVLAVFDGMFAFTISKRGEYRALADAGVGYSAAARP